MELVAPGVWRVEQNENLWTIYNKAKNENDIQLTRDEFLENVRRYQSLGGDDQSRIFADQLIVFYRPNPDELEAALARRVYVEEAKQRSFQIAARYEFEILQRKSLSPELSRFAKASAWTKKATSQMGFGIGLLSLYEIAWSSTSGKPMTFKNWVVTSEGTKASTFLNSPYAKSFKVAGGVLTMIGTAYDVKDLACGLGEKDYGKVSEATGNLGLTGIAVAVPWTAPVVFVGKASISTAMGIHGKILDQRERLSREAQYSFRMQLLHQDIPIAEKDAEEKIDALLRPGGIIYQ